MKYKLYEKIRTEVLEKATLPCDNNSTKQTKNQEELKKTLRKLCCPIDKITPAIFFKQYWEHHRWAGIRASTGSNDITIHKNLGFFSNFKNLTSPEWDYPERVKWHCESGWGTAALGYLKKNDVQCKKYVANPYKLKKTIKMARAINKAIDKHGEEFFLKDILSEHFYDDCPKVKTLDDPSFNIICIKNWLKNLNKVSSGFSNLTFLHLLMDLQFQTVKPDIVVTDLLYRLGWLSDVLPSATLTREDLRTRYTKPNVFWHVIKICLEIAKEHKPIISQNAVREVDFFIVKFGQERDPNIGIERNLDREVVRIQDLM